MRPAIIGAAVLFGGWAPRARGGGMRALLLLLAGCAASAEAVPGGACADEGAQSCAVNPAEDDGFYTCTDGVWVDPSNEVTGCACRPDPTSGAIAIECWSND